MNSDDYIGQKENLIRLPKNILADINIQNSVLIHQMQDDMEKHDIGQKENLIELPKSVLADIIIQNSVLIHQMQDDMEKHERHDSFLRHVTR